MTKLRLLAVGAAGVALFLPVLLPHPFVLSIATQAVIWALLAASWDLLSGYTGQVSFGHVGFYAVGAYTVAILTTRFGWSFWTAWPLLVGVIAGHQAWTNGQWDVDVGLHNYSEPLSTLLVTTEPAVGLTDRQAAELLAWATRAADTPGPAPRRTGAPSAPAARST